VTLHLSLPAAPVTPPDTKAVLEILDTLRGCDADADWICDGVTQFTAVSPDPDGISRGLVAGTEKGVLVVLLNCAGPCWQMHFVRTAPTGETNVTLPISHMLRRKYAATLAPMVGIAA
jgi:hypothetical protein